MIISTIDYLVSKRLMSLFDLVEKNEINQREANIFMRIMGLKMISRDPTLTPYLLAFQLIQRLIQNCVIKLNTIKYILIAHTADHIITHQMSFLSMINCYPALKNTVLFESCAYKCATAFQYIHLANLLFENLKNNHSILLLIIDTCFTDILKKIDGSTVMGDAGCALILRKSGPHHEVLDVLIDSNGYFSRGDDPNCQLLFQNSYVCRLVTCIHAILIKNKIKLDDIKMIFPHNVNLTSWTQVANSLPCPIEKIYLKNIARIGHCFGADPFINLKDALAEKNISSGDYYLLVTVGLGATFAVILMRY